MEVVVNRRPPSNMLPVSNGKPFAGDVVYGRALPGETVQSVVAKRFSARLIAHGENTRNCSIPLQGRRSPVIAWPRQTHIDWRSEFRLNHLTYVCASHTRTTSGQVTHCVDQLTHLMTAVTYICLLQLDHTQQRNRDTHESGPRV